MNSIRHLPLLPLLTTLLLLLSGGRTGAQERGVEPYVSQRLTEIASTLFTDYHIDCRKAQVCTFGKGRLVVAENEQHMIGHIGFQIFARNLIEENPSPVYYFVERYLLELCLEKGPADILRRLKEDKVRLRFGEERQKTIQEKIWEIVPRLTRSRNSLVVLTDHNYYTVSFYDGKSLLFAMRFPIQYELLWGMRKMEVEDRFYTNLLQYRPLTQTSNEEFLPESDIQQLVAINDSCFALPGENYAIEAMNDTRYYKKLSNGNYIPLCDTGYPEESVHNLFQFPGISGVKASVTQHLYKYRKLTFEIPLSHLLSFCHKTGCRTYVGIESRGDKRITGTSILLNSMHGYCHLLYFDIETEWLAASGLQGDIHIHLYAYVPTHNIGALFPEQKGERDSH